MSRQRKGPTVAEGQPFIGYVRVSTDEQAGSGLGLQAQRAAIRRDCELRSRPLGTIHTDTASGRSMDRREGLQAALSELETGRASGLVVAKLDRLSRSLLDFASLMERSRSEGWALIALDLGVDTSTPQGELMASVLATFSQFERRLIGQRTKDALAELKSQGVELGRPRLLDDELAVRVRSMRAGGMTLQAIADTLNSEGVPTATRRGAWRTGTVHHLLSRDLAAATPAAR
jgi:DNA invertase Pin-like site-specific DNA recombinase